MSDDKNDQNKRPLPAQTETPEDKNPQNKQSLPAPADNKAGRNYVFIALIILLPTLLLAATGGLGYYVWLELNKRLDQAAAERQLMAQNIAAVDANESLQNFEKYLQENVATINQHLIRLSEQIKEQADLQEQSTGSTQEIIAYVNRDQSGWRLKEVEHILRMANHRLHVERDVAGAVTALNMASSRLREFSDQRLLPVRESIFKQVETLKNFLPPDWVSIDLRLDRVLAELKRDLTQELEQKDDNVREGRNHADNNEKLSAWRKFVDYIKTSVSGSIKITRGGPKALVSQPEKQRAYEFLHLKLLSTRYAVARRDDESYHRELGAALTWLENTGSLSNSSQLMREIQALDAIDLKPALPDISAPNRLLADTIEIIEHG